MVYRQQTQKTGQGISGVFGKPEFNAGRHN